MEDAEAFGAKDRPKFAAFVVGLLVGCIATSAYFLGKEEYCFRSAVSDPKNIDGSAPIFFSACYNSTFYRWKVRQQIEPTK